MELSVIFLTTLAFNLLRPVVADSCISHENPWHCAVPSISRKVGVPEAADSSISPGFCPALTSLLDSLMRAMEPTDPQWLRQSSNHSLSSQDFCLDFQECLLCVDWSSCNLLDCGTDFGAVRAVQVEHICNNIPLSEASELQSGPISSFCATHGNAYSHVCLLVCFNEMVDNVIDSGPRIPIFDPPDEPSDPDDDALQPPNPPTTDDDGDDIGSPSRGQSSVYSEYGKPYLGANSLHKQKTIVWSSRISAMLTFLGASFIAWDVLSHQEKRKHVYHQLLVMMACFDLFTALAWSFSSAAIPRSQARNS